MAAADVETSVKVTIQAGVNRLGGIFSLKEGITTSCCGLFTFFHHSVFFLLNGLLYDC